MKKTSPKPLTIKQANITRLWWENGEAIAEQVYVEMGGLKSRRKKLKESFKPKNHFCGGCEL